MSDTTTTPAHEPTGDTAIDSAHEKIAALEAKVAELEQAIEAITAPVKKNK